MLYKVRDQFCVHLDGQAHEAGTVLDLTPEQAENHAAQIEEVQQPTTPKRRKVKPNDDLQPGQQD
jgi:hypothetical protein